MRSLMVNVLAAILLMGTLPTASLAAEEKFNLGSRDIEVGRWGE